MRFLVLAALAIAPPLAAQNWYVPDNNAAMGQCNVIPFGHSVGGPFYQAKYQIKATQADLGALPGLITGLGFAACAPGGQSHFSSLEIVLDHHPAGQPLSNVFANNLTPNAMTVLSATDYTWNTTTDTWHEIGLQNYFVYLGVDDLVIQITSVDGTSPGGFHTGNRPRMYWFASSGSPPASGTTDLAAHKFELSMLMARISSHGIGCPGSNGTPRHSTSGAPQIAQTIGFDLTNGTPGGFAILVLGFYNGTPVFPLELSPYGMPGCYQFHDVASVLFTPLDPGGSGSAPFTIPNDGGLIGVKLYSQFACIDPPANATGITTSNYNRILIGN